MLWGDWRVCTFETLCLPLAKRIFSKTYPSFLTLKEGSTSHPCPLSSGAREETALLGARNRFALRLADHQRSSPTCADWDRMDIVGLTSCIFQCCAEKLEEVVVFLLMLFKKLCQRQSLQFSFLGNLT